MTAELNIMTSSGTSGTYSFVPRDLNTRMGLMANSAIVFQPVFGKVLENISDYAVEGYSMIEMNTMMTCCSEARFHIPPVMEPVVFDEDLLPKEGAGQTGIFGFLDPFALSYPGFLISGDQIKLWHGQCACGRKGHAIDSEIQRVAEKEVKGYGGILASVKA